MTYSSAKPSAPPAPRWAGDASRRSTPTGCPRPTTGTVTRTIRSPRSTLRSPGSVFANSWRVLPDDPYPAPHRPPQEYVQARIHQQLLHRDDPRRQLPPPQRGRRAQPLPYGRRLRPHGLTGEAARSVWRFTAACSRTTQNTPALNTKTAKVSNPVNQRCESIMRHASVYPNDLLHRAARCPCPTLRRHIIVILRQDQRVEGTGEQSVLVNLDGGTRGDLHRGHRHGSSHRPRTRCGGPAPSDDLAQRGELLKQMANALHEHREELLDIAERNNGGTRGDAKFDVDGATGTLASYAASERSSVIRHCWSTARSRASRAPASSRTMFACHDPVSPCAPTPSTFRPGDLREGGCGHPGGHARRLARHSDRAGLP